MTNLHDMAIDDITATAGCNSEPALNEAAISAAVDGAAVPVLLMLLYQVTGDEKWLGEKFQPGKFKGVAPRISGGLPPEVQAEVREAAVPAIMTLLSGVPPKVELDLETTVRAAGFFVGEQIDDRYGAILCDELSRRSGQTRRKPVADNVGGSAVTVPDGFHAIIIGMGISGLAAIDSLQQLGVDFTVFERGAEAGGVWFQNSYPGAGVDTPSYLYSFSFSNRDWDQHYALRDELYDYFNGVLDELSARDKVRFSTEVLSADYDEDTALWTVTTRTPDGTIEKHRANMVISCVGSLNVPRLPELPGMDDFRGLQFHSNVWPENLDLRGKKVAIVGAGASSQQISPAIAPVVDRLTVVQRTPQWAAPFEQFRQTVADSERLLLTHVPLYRAWNWVGLFWQHGDRIIDGLRVDPTWSNPDRSVNARNDRARAFLTSYIHNALEGRPDLIEKAVPDYPPFGKRMLLDNGWYDMLKRDNVDLVADRVVGVTEDGLVFGSGDTVDVDVIIWATGFKATHFLSSLEVRGEGGRRLRDEWHEDDPRGYLGVSIPHFPNFFTIGGPHSLPASGSFMYVTEMQARYLAKLLEEMFRQGITAVDATEVATDRYNDLVDDRHDRTVWCHPGFATYYRNSKGRVIFVMPFLNVEYWEFVRTPQLTDFTQHSLPTFPRPR